MPHQSGGLGLDTYEKFIFLRTYARYLWEEGRREYWEETVDRYCSWLFEQSPHAGKIPAKVKTRSKYNILDKRAMPSMRAMWTAGVAADQENATIYNCSGVVVDDLRAFGEVLYLLMCGTGVGFSAERRYVEKLPAVRRQHHCNPDTHVIEDSRIGWKRALDAGFENWWSGRDIYFDFSQLRPMGAPLRTMGGRSSGGDVLRKLLAYCREAIVAAQGRKLRPIEVFDLMCEIASVVVVGGTRRSALICLSDLDDEEMRNAKSGDCHPRRFGSNISATYHDMPDILRFLDEWVALAKSGRGERGIANLMGVRRGTPHRRRGRDIVLLNPCKPLRSLVLTANGYRTFAQCLTEPSLLVHTADGTKTASSPFVTGEKVPVHCVTLSNGCRLYGTADHRHQTIDGQWVKMEEMTPGTRLAAPLLPVHDLNPDGSDYDRDMGTVAGWLWADGSFYERGLQFAFGHHEMDVAPLLSSLLDKSAIPHDQKPETCLLINTHRDWVLKMYEVGYGVNKGNLDWLYLQSPRFKWAFIKAAFTADGSVLQKNNVELYSIHREALETLCHILREFGILSCVQIHNQARSYVASDGKQRNNAACWKLNVYAGQYTLIGFLSEFKNDKLKSQSLTGVYRHTDYLTVKTVDGVVAHEDVYDISVSSEDHAFMDSGVVTHNCGEVGLRDREFCNLSEAVVRADDDFESLRDKLTTATWIGVLQSTYTHFPGLSEQWTHNCEEERLIGVSLTGQLDNLDLLSPEVLRLSRQHVVATARKAAKTLGINPPAACTLVKPSGTVSKLVGCSAGLHPRWSKYYAQNVAVATSDPLFRLMVDQGAPYRDLGNGSALISFPISSPDGAVTRHDLTAIEQLEWYRTVTQEWCEHNASCTVYVGRDEWISVASWVYDHFEDVRGVTFLPKETDGSCYEWMPFEELSPAEYGRRLQQFPAIDFDRLPDYENGDQTEGAKEIACAGGQCEV